MIAEPAWTTNNFMEFKITNRLYKMTTGNHGLHWNRHSPVMFSPGKVSP
jgi:hypothetical protein